MEVMNRFKDYAQLVQLEIDDINIKNGYPVIAEAAAMYDREDFDMFVGGVQYRTRWDVEIEGVVVCLFTALFSCFFLGSENSPPVTAWGNELRWCLLKHFFKCGRNGEIDGLLLAHYAESKTF